MSDIGNRAGALLPTPIDTWEHNNTLNGRRLLPSPAPKKEYVESEKARSVRLLLAKHGDQVLQMNNNKIRENDIKISSSTEELSDEFVSSNAPNVMPGDSFPSTANQLVAISMNDIEEEDGSHSEDEQELLKRLGQGQARMEQIKRMLVNQRGFIVQALKQMTETNSAHRETRQQFAEKIREQKEAIEALTSEQQSCAKCRQDSADDEASIEKDRTLGKGSLVNFGFNDSSSEEWAASNNLVQRTCPMCEAAFPQTVTDEDFEMHVMEHFTFEEQETLRYVPHSSNAENGYN